MAAVVLGVAAPAAIAQAGVSLERVTLTDAATEVPLLQSRGLDVTEEVTPTSAVVVAHDDADRRALRATGLPLRTLVADVTAPVFRPRALTTPSALPSGRTTYRTPAEVQGDLDRLVAAHPGLVRAVVLPHRSVEGRPITGVEIAQNVNRTDDGRPVYVVLADTHAREWPSAEIAVEFALDLVAHQTEPRIAALLGALRIVVVPVVNPDGYAYSRGTLPGGQPDTAAALKRRNCRALAGDPAGAGCAAHRGVDLNRNFGAYWGGLGASTSPDDETYRGAGPWSEPEAAAIHDFTARLGVTGVQSLHNVAALVLRPPGFRDLGLAPDEPKLKALGDAMAAATGYDSRYGYELYEVTGAAEDWNYVAQGAFGYTIETGGAFPGDPDFTGTYQTHVIDQYLGVAGTPTAGRGVREALLLAAEEAADPRDHIVVYGHAASGTVLRLHKQFVTPTSPRCTDTMAAGACGPTLPAIASPDGLDLSLTVGPDGAFAWHAGPSTRPFERAAGRRETWTLDCLRGTGVVATKTLFADRGQTVAVDPCDRASLPVTHGGSRTVAPVRVSVVAAAQRVRRGRLQIAVRCPVTCRVGVVVRDGTAEVAHRGRATLRRGHRSHVAVPLTAGGRRRLRAVQARRHLVAAVTLSTVDGNTITVLRRFVVRGA